MHSRAQLAVLVLGAFALGWLSHPSDVQQIPLRPPALPPAPAPASPKPTPDDDEAASLPIAADLAPARIAADERVRCMRNKYHVASSVCERMLSPPCFDPPLGATVHSVLALGDSLTEGFMRVRGEPRYAPYANSLVYALPGSRVVEAGVSGEKIAQIDARLQALLARVPRGYFTHVVVLAGTNDVLMSDEQLPEPRDMLAELGRVHARIWEHGAASIGLTLPESPRFVAERDRLVHAYNDLIRTQLCAAAPSNVACRILDLHARLPFSNADGLWADDVHPSRRGYEVMGDMVAALIQEIGSQGL